MQICTCACSCVLAHAPAHFIAHFLVRFLAHFFAYVLLPVQVTKPRAGGKLGFKALFSLMDVTLRVQRSYTERFPVSNPTPPPPHPTSSHPPHQPLPHPPHETLTTIHLPPQCCFQQQSYIIELTVPQYKIPWLHKMN